MEETKKWWESKTMWGGVAALVAGLADAAGFDVDASQVTELALKAVEVLGIVTVIFGRLTATKRIA